jgi:hypothetical protein
MTKKTKKTKRPYIGEITATRVPKFAEQERGFQFDSSRVCFRCKARPRLSYASYCRECQNEYAGEWRAANLEKVQAQQRAQTRARRTANPEKAAAQTRAWRAANLEKVQAQGRARYAANPEKMHARSRAQQAKRRAADPEKARAYDRAWQAAKREKMRAAAASKVCFRCKVQPRRSHSPYCRDCCNERQRERYANSEKGRAWRAANREKMLARMRTWWAANRGQVLSYRWEIGPECCWP